MFALFGPVIMSLNPLTGPNKFSEKFGNSFARHDVIRGKPVVQNIGRELDTREIGFFFDETFCDPGAQWAMLYGAYLMKEALPFIAGYSFDGRRFVIETLTLEVQKTSKSGVPVRIEATMSLIEAPQPSLLDMLINAVSGGSSSNNPEVRQ